MAYRSLTIAVGLLVALTGCGEGSGGPRTGGTGGTAGSGGTAGTAGSGGVGGTGAVGGAGGSGGSGASGGTGGTGGGPACVTNGLCFFCPDTCESSDDCAVGETCAPSGCTTNGGDPIQQCFPVPGGACETSDDCPAEYACESVGFGKSKCIKQTPGCNTTSDCVLGFSCEGDPGACVDRRVACESFEDCPKSHTCRTFPNAAYCVRVNQACLTEDDCSEVGTPLCVDIDGDGATECAGSTDPNQPSPPACFNSDCGGAAPVCEVGVISSLAECGQYGLCRLDTDCASGFVCAPLWPDGRKECVEAGGSCSQISDCPAQQVCASPRNGGPPSCQSGSAL
ncbi:MAG: hypothetical protein ACN4G0_15975 [Polyangiales bacterium]